MISNTFIRCTLLYLAVGTIFFQSLKKQTYLPDSVNNKQDLETIFDNNAIPINPYYIVDSLGKRTQIFNEHPSAKSEQERLHLHYLQSDFLPTGFYLKAGDIAQLHVELVAGTALPKLLIGTYVRNGKEPQVVQLQTGNNDIIASKNGTLWIRYGTEDMPSSSAKITFTKGGRNVPTFVKNKTSQVDFAANITSSDAAVHDILFIGQKTFAVVPKEVEIFKTQNNNIFIQRCDEIWEHEDRISGLDGSSSLHEPTKIPHVMIQKKMRSGVGAYTANYATAYPTTAFIETAQHNKFWFQRHEFGHMHHQQWKWNPEILADFYAISTAMNMGLPAEKIGKSTKMWTEIKAHYDEYFNMPEDQRNYETIWDYHKENNKGELNRYLGSLMLIQLKYAFGDRFYQQFHKLVREEKPSLSTRQETHQYFMRKACEVSGYDLTAFFKKWGFKYPEAYAAIAALNLPQPATDPSSLFNGDTPIK